MKKTNYLCVDLKVRTQGRMLTENQCCKGMLMMREKGEKFEFDETLPDSYPRNPKVWKGTMLSVSKSKKGELIVNFKRIVLDTTLDPCKFADEVFVELERAKVELGL